MTDVLLNGKLIRGVQWDGTTGTFTVPPRAPGGRKWAHNQKVHLQVVVDGMASEPVILVVQPRAAPGTG